MILNDSIWNSAYYEDEDDDEHASLLDEDELGGSEFYNSQDIHDDHLLDDAEDEHAHADMVSWQFILHLFLYIFVQIFHKLHVVFVIFVKLP